MKVLHNQGSWRDETALLTGFGRGMCAVMLAITLASAAQMPTATADASDPLRAALAAARGDSCGPLQSNPAAEQIAADANESDDRWLNRTTRAVPVEIAVAPGARPDAIPLLKDIGYESKKAAILYGAGATEAESIRALLLEGYVEIPDCEFVAYGAYVSQNETKHLIMSTVVLTA